MDIQLGLFGDEPDRERCDRVRPQVPDSGHAELAGRLPPGLRLGTSSWTFPGWRGIVYDRGAPSSALAKEGLAAYARHPLLRTVGVDRTYYRSVGADVFEEYATGVPDDFRFLVKADRLLTSPTDTGPSRLRGANPVFLDSRFAAEHVVQPVTQGLGGKAGPILFQFSPMSANLVGGRTAFAERLRSFLERLPEGPLYAIELRTPALFTEEYARVLEDTGAAHCFTVHPAMLPLEAQTRLIRPFEQPTLVVRWMLHAGLEYAAAKDRYEPFDALVDEDPHTRGRIATAVLDALVAERGVFVIVNNKAEGSSPLSVFRLAESIGGWGPDERRRSPEADR